MAAMAKLQHSNTLPNVYCKLVNTLTLLNFPLYIALFVLAEPIVDLVCCVSAAARSSAGMPLSLASISARTREFSATLGCSERMRHVFL